MAESKLAGPIRLALQTISSGNVFSVVLVCSMLSLGCILILDLANLLMYILPGIYDATLLGCALLTLKVFLHEIDVTHLHIIAIAMYVFSSYHDAHTYNYTTYETYTYI